MPRYLVSGVATVSVTLGVVEAASPDAAIERAQNEWPPQLCHQCSLYTELDGEPMEVTACETDYEVTIE